MSGAGREDDGFLQRWARRKARVQQGAAEPEPEPRPTVAAPPTATLPDAVAPAAVPAAASTALPPADSRAEPPPPAPTMEDVAGLTRDSDYSRFVGGGVDPAVSNAAMRKLFRDPCFNVMDGLDVYIDDYGKPDPIPESMLRQLNQSKMLRLFEVDEDAAEALAGSAAAEGSPDVSAPVTVAQSPGAPVSPPPTDDDPDLRLQQDDAAGRPGTEPGPRA
jgi:hypothetical protein